MTPFSVRIAPSLRIQAALIALHIFSIGAAWHYFHGTVRYALTGAFCATLLYNLLRHSRFVPQIRQIDIRPDGKALICTTTHPAPQPAQILSGSLNHPLLHILSWQLTENGEILRHSIFAWQADADARRRLSVWLRFLPQTGEKP